MARAEQDAENAPHERAAVTASAGEPSTACVKAVKSCSMTTGPRFLQLLLDLGRGPIGHFGAHSPILHALLICCGVSFILSAKAWLIVISPPVS